MSDSPTVLETEAMCPDCDGEGAINCSIAGFELGIFTCPTCNGTGKEVAA